MKLHRELGPEEEAVFRKWARDNYVPFTDIRGIWHPVVQDECVEINRKAEYLPDVELLPGMEKIVDDMKGGAHGQS